mmetsp:Transcript_21517/g.30148  ORF Transcript_21517/g.30148 Transcript_21517/m.30148 type:complete len:211 (-) Transcript_21517:121-753(-)
MLPSPPAAVITHPELCAHRAFPILELILGRLLGSSCPLELLENSEALRYPLSESWLHLLTLHFVQASHLLVDVVDAFRFPLFSIFDLLLATTGPGSCGTQGRAAVLFDVSLHVLIVSELVAHSFGSLLIVSSPSISGLRIKEFNGRPTSPTRVVVASDWLLGEVDVPKSYIRVVCKGLHDTVPCRRLLTSSASSFRGNPADEECLARIHL